MTALYDDLRARLAARGHDLDTFDPGALAVASIFAMAADMGPLPGFTAQVTDREAFLTVLVAGAETGHLTAAYARPTATTPSNPTPQH